MTPVALIAAVAANGVIGRDNQLVWRLRSDMAQFRKATAGRPLVVGRKTFESFGRPLPGRLNIVVTRNPAYVAAGAVVCGSLDIALAVAHGEALRSGIGEIVVLGGAEIYAQALPLADRLLITHVAASPDGDSLFPAIDAARWSGREVMAVAAGPGDDHAFSVVEYRRYGAG